MELKRARTHFVVASVFVVSLGLSSIAFADDLHGVIAQHNGDGTLTIQADDASTVTVVVADRTKVRRQNGMRSSKASTASLVPGLRVEVSGKYNDSNRMVADRVTFKTSDMKTALAIQGGLGPTDMRVAANEQRIAQQEAILKQQEQRIAENNAKIVATTGMVEAATARISNLDNYNILGSFTVYFDNGKSTVPAKYRHHLEQMIAQAKALQGDLHGYLVQVQGYASAVGSGALNERLSTDRAVAVTRILQQNGVPPTSIAPPAGMGITNQVSPNTTEKGQAENRRVVITLLQNKGITGK
jgi:outer membrane protein OmpA-like peptidoglycan-associated protein